MSYSLKELTLLCRFCICWQKYLFFFAPSCNKNDKSSSSRRLSSAATPILTCPTSRTTSRGKTAPSWPMNTVSTPLCTTTATACAKQSVTSYTDYINSFVRIKKDTHLLIIIWSSKNCTRLAWENKNMKVDLVCLKGGLKVNYPNTLGCWKQSDGWGGGMLCQITVIIDSTNI